MFGLEGRLDEVALYDRVLNVEEVAAHFAVAKATQEPQINEVIARPDTPPMSPAESMKVAHVRKGFELQLVVAEPLVIDPVAIDWGPDGKLWVAEMADYPSGMDNNGKPGGRIRYLEDKDGDGKYETSTVLLQDIPFPTGVMAWGKGVLITAAPEIIYAEDTNNDGTADVRKTLFSGFLEGNQQLRVNGLRWGLDNWVHCASGSHHPGYGADSQILSHVTNQKTTVGSRDFRIRPDEGLIDPQSGPSQFGRNRDAWGNWFGEQNSYPLWHYVLEDPYIRRNPFFAPPDPRRLMTPSNPPVYAAAPPEKRFHSFEQSGRYTSACSGIVYLDEVLFGASKADGRLNLSAQHVFTCEPFSNLVQHNLLIDDGVSFRLERDPAEVDAKHDFFASEDRWCRPVMVRTGPDGALWIVDMYRYMIEHPHWLPKEGQDELRPFFRSGDDRGRIYRIVRKDLAKYDSIAKGVSPRFDQLTTSELVSELESSNGWRRDTAQRLLVTNADEAAVELLTRMVTEGQRPTARLHAMCTLDGMGKLSKELVETALNDPHAGVRRWAVRLSPGAKVPLQALVRMAEDEDAKVRLELACVAGSAGDASSSAAILSASLLRDTSPFVRAAVLSSLNFENVRPVIDLFMKTAGLDAWSNPPNETDLPGFSAADRDELIASLFEQAASLANDNDLNSLLTRTTELHPEHPQAWHFKSYSGMLNRLKIRNWSIEEHLNSDTDKGRLAEIHRIACATAGDSKQHEALRVAAIPLLKCSRDDSNDVVILRDILTPQTPTAIQEAAIKHLGQQSEDVAAEILLANWASHSPLLRSQILMALSGRPEWIVQLLTQMESGQVAAAEIDASMRQRLLTIREPAVRERLEKIFASGTSADRKAVMESFQPALKLSGDAVQGAAVFNKRCSTCHKQNGVGFEVGPNLASLSNRTPETLFSAILDPSAAVEAKYLNFVAVTTSGRSVIGLLSTETGSSLTLVAAEAKTESILRSDIEELRSTGKSLMPVGLEKDLTHQDLADVIEYVRTLMK
jgi:putative membrane-bound dehydrogenase-like protein